MILLRLGKNDKIYFIIKNSGVVLDSCLIQILLFADDTVVMAQTEEDLTEKIERLYVAMKRHGLAINWSKSNTMVFSKEYKSVRWRLTV